MDFVGMAPKRKKADQAPTPTSAPKRRQRSCQEVTVVEPTIDYERLADAIVRRQSGSTPTNSATTTEGDITPLEAIPAGQIISGPSNMTSCGPSVATTDKPGSSVDTNNTTVSSVDTTNTSQPNDVADNLSIPVVLNTLFGGESATSNEPQPLNFTKNIPLGATVSNKLKQKIWDNTFFDLRLLLPNQQDDDFSVSVERGAINFQHGKYQKFPISINQWTSAFLIFGSIHMQKTPSDAPHLFKYMYMIRDMCFTAKNDAWRYYDEEFRKLRQSSPLPWQEPLSELMMRANLQPTKSRQTNQPFLAKKQNPNYPNNRIKFCYSFNQGHPCRSDPCVYKHACQYCKEQHPRFRCPKLPSGEDRPSTKHPHNSKPKNP